MAEATADRRTGLKRIFDRSIADVGEDVTRYEDRAARIWLYSAVAWFVFVTFVGLTMAMELVSPNLFGGTSFMVFSRIRQVHVNGVILAWMTMGMVAGLHYFLPRLLGVPRMWSESMGYWAAWGWNVMFIAGFVFMGLGYTQSREYWSFIWPVDALAIVVWGAVIINVVMTVINRRVRALYAAVWFFLAAPLWLGADLILANVIWRPGSILGNGVANGILSGALPNPLHDLMLNWWGSHNLFGLWLTPMLVAFTYYLVPRITNTALYSHTLSLISFWGLAFIYTSVGGHHIMQAPMPIWAKTFATFYSVLLLLPVFAFVSNTWLTMRGNWDKFARNLPLRFAITALIFYLLVNVQGAFMSIQPFNRLIHFTNFTIAHAHLCFLGAMTPIIMAGIYYMLPQFLKRPIYSRHLAEMQYWIWLFGFLLYFWSITFAAFVQGQNWIHGTPEVNVLPMLIPHYIARGAAGVMVFAAAVIQGWNVWRTVAAPTRMRLRSQMKPYLAAAEPREQEG